MSAWCEVQTLQGAAKWLRLQSQEEYGHAMKLYDFVLARGGQVDLKALPAPTQSYKSLHDVFDKVLKQEQTVSRQIDELYDLVFYRPAVLVSGLFRRGVEEPLIGGSIAGVTLGAREAGGALGEAQTGYLRSYALAIAGAVAVLVVVFITVQ